MAYERIRVHTGYTKSGAPIYTRVGGKTQDERNAAIVLALYNSGRIWEIIPRPVSDQAVVVPAVSKQRTDFKSYAWAFYRRYKEPKLAENSKVFFTTALNKLCLRFSEYAVEEITVNDIQDWMNERARDGVSRKTINDQRKVISSVLKSAMEDGLIEKNPAVSSRLNNPGRETEGTIPLSLKRFREIISIIPEINEPSKQMLLCLYCLTGMRREEVLGLRWEDIDFETRQIHVQRALAYPKGMPCLKPPKSKAGNRFIPLPDLLLNILTLHRKSSGYVIAKEDGEPLNEKQYQSAFAELQRDYNLRDVNALVFRSTFATMLAAAGMEPKTLQSIMGHSKIAVTMDVYAKLEKTRLDANRNTLSDFLKIKDFGQAFGQAHI